MKHDHAKQVENGALIAQRNKPCELTIADLDGVIGGSGKQSGVTLAARCCNGKHIDSAKLTV